MRWCIFFVISLNMNQDMLLLQQGARLLGIELGDEQFALFDLYQNELLKWNAKTNLISEKTAGEIVTRHFLDSLSAAEFITNPNARLVDIGCGAGFPGIPLKIAMPSLQLYLLETNRKKVSFLKHIIRTLNLPEQLLFMTGRKTLFRQITGRKNLILLSPAPLLNCPNLLPLGQYFLAPDGLLIALKGPDVDAEFDTVLGR